MSNPKPTTSLSTSTTGARLLKHVLAAESRIRKHIRTTPLEACPWLSKLAGPSTRVFLKCESEQATGSFKLRGAFAKLTALIEAAEHQATLPRQADSDQNVLVLPRIVTASTGNHALACCAAMQSLGISGTICVPSSITRAKRERLELMRAKLIVGGRECLDAENAAQELAQRSGAVYVSPYNDWDVAGGNGTVAVDLVVHQGLHNVDAVFVAVGGGGLIGGMAAFLKALVPNVRIVGCSPMQSCVMVRSVEAGRIVDEAEDSETLSDGTAGGIEPGSLTFDVCRDLVDEWVTVSEVEIARAMRFMLEYHHRVVEGAAGVAIAAFRKHAQRFAGQTVAIVLCGSNVSMNHVAQVSSDVDLDLDMN
ncbi:L-threonine ammonia-lyase [Capsaspora owczarzaki ATCC 30864]|uniref:L-threonine ammonia-lyase n=1 Tax=Capsaspora owczarzaki (strain ATCC 30864) TaxID=595528 RepID=A0A0D2VR34_CAPO3|nr:L-threonine ammonia-lyase [Capsaspora owczarzaki ATCC 30864]KJE93302.1 L-threonine ammonia-lyase [Capsaspora owczarzaki ATCC 30864]|eukprot:XP_004347933.1 L-threonine ammonia-lyase [Capsaspora owczarzaki ATCC 30864]